MMSFWTFSDVFEEGGPMPKPFQGAFGLRAKGGINKPSFYDFALLHQLGDQRIPASSKNIIATKLANGELVVAAWNLVDPGEKGGSRTMQIEFTNVPRDAKVTIQRVDDEHGNVLPKYIAMGKPLDPTEDQVMQLNRQTDLGSPELTKLKDGRIELVLERNALWLMRIGTP